MKDFIDSGIVQKGAKNSLNFVTRDVVFPKKFDRIMKKGGEPYRIIGEVVKGQGKIIIK